MTVDASSAVCNLEILDALTDDSIREMGDSWNSFCFAVEALLKGKGDLSLSSEFVSHVQILCQNGLESLVQQHFLCSIEDALEKNGAMRFWQHFEPYSSLAALEMNNNPVNMKLKKLMTPLSRFLISRYENKLSILKEYQKLQKDEIQLVLCKALDEISSEKQYQEKCLRVLIHALQGCTGSSSDGRTATDIHNFPLFSKYQLMVSSVLMASLPRHFPVVLHLYFKGCLEDLSTIMEEDYVDDSQLLAEDDMDVDEKGKFTLRSTEMDIDGQHHQRRFSDNSKLVKSIGVVVRDLRNLGLTSMTEDAYASAIFLLLRAKVQDLAGDDFRTSVLESIKGWIQAVPLQFLHALLSYLGDSTSSTFHSCDARSPLASCPSSLYFKTEAPSEGLVRWQLRLEYFAYETLQDLRIAKLFEIIVDYPDSAPAIEDLKICLEYTGQHAKLVESFISSLRYRLLTAGASTNDILHQYVSTIKALRTIDSAGVFLEAVSEPIREYLRGRKDTIKCIVTMLTDGSGANNSGSAGAGDSLLEELNRDEENQENTGVDDDISTDDKQAWINAQCWEPDPVEADPTKGSRNRRKVDILGMIVGIIGSKDQLVNEYRVMLAEKLLNKSDYEIDSEIRTLELLKIHFGESSMQRCEIMLNDLIDSKRTNTNIRATIKQQPHPVCDEEQHQLSLDILSSTIISSNFWPPIQDEAIKLPLPVEQLLSDYASRFHQIKTPRKLLWKKNLGTVKLELQFEDRELQFTVTPLQASMIMQFEDQKSWTSKDLAATLGVPVDVLNRKISFWVSKGILVESAGADTHDHIFTLVEAMIDNGKTGGSNGTCEELMAGDEEGERAVASAEDQLRKEMNVYEKFITGMLTNFGSMAVDRIHNTLKMFCIADPPYDKTLQQLQSFLSGLVAEEKLELREGVYLLKK